MTRFLASVALTPVGRRRAWPGHPAGPGVPGDERCGARVRDRHRRRRPARDEPHTRGLRDTRRRKAAADHALRQHAAAHPPHRDAGCLRQHVGQPAAAARRCRSSCSRGCARTTACASGRSGTRSTSARRSRATPRELRAALPESIADDAPTPLWRATDEALAAFGEDTEDRPVDPRLQRRQGQRPDQLPPAVRQPGRGHRARAQRRRDGLRHRAAQPEHAGRPCRASVQAAFRRR